MPDLEDEELEGEATEPVVAPPETVEEGAEGGAASEEDDPQPARGPMDFEDLLDPNNGLIYGKFKDPIEAARAYKEAEKQMGRKAQEAADLRRTMTEAGFTFDAQGRPVPPAAKPAAPAPEAAPAEAQPQAPPDLATSVRTENGIGYNYLGMPIISEQEWEEQRSEDYDEYIRLRARYEGQTAARLESWRQGQQAQQKRQRAALMEQTRATVRETAKAKLDMPDDLFEQIERHYQNDVVPTLEPHLRDDPKAYEIGMQLVAAELQPAYYRNLLKQALEGGAEARTKAQRVVRTERNGAAPGAPPAPEANGLTADERRMAKELGVSEADYVKYRNA